MATNYSNVTSRRTVQVLGPTTIIDVEEVGFVTKPHGVFAQREVPYEAWISEGPAAWVAPLASAIEGLLDGGLATGADFVQDVDDAGLLTDYMDFTVTYQPAGGIGLPFSTRVRIPVNALTLDTSFGSYLGTSPADLLQQAYQRLIETAGE